MLKLENTLCNKKKKINFIHRLKIYQNKDEVKHKAETSFGVQRRVKHKFGTRAFKVLST